MTAPVEEHEHVPAQWLQPEFGLDYSSKPIEALARVYGLNRHVDLHTRRQCHHRVPPSTAASSRLTLSTSKSPAIRTHRPLANTTSKLPARGRTGVSLTWTARNAGCESRSLPDSRFTSCRSRLAQPANVPSCSP